MAEGAYGLDKPVHIAQHHTVIEQHRRIGAANLQASLQERQSLIGEARLVQGHGHQLQKLPIFRIRLQGVPAKIAGGFQITASEQGLDRLETPAFLIVRRQPPSRPNGS